MTTRSAVDTAALNLRTATSQMAGMRVPPRVRTIPNPRRRLPISVISEPPRPVAIRQNVHNMDSAVNETGRNGIGTGLVTKAL